jgi:hypothetical protein
VLRGLPLGAQTRGGIGLAQGLVGTGRCVRIPLNPLAQRILGVLSSFCLSPTRQALHEAFWNQP